jgi:hypothetical protein
MRQVSTTREIVGVADLSDQGREIASFAFPLATWVEVAPYFLGSRGLAQFQNTAEEVRKLVLLSSP